MEKGAEKQVAFARSPRSFVTPAPSVWDLCFRRIAPLLICECGGRAEGLGLPLRCVGASCVVWPGLGYTSSAPDLQRRRRLITARRFAPTSSSRLGTLRARARARTNTNTSLYTRLKRKGGFPLKILDAISGGVPLAGCTEEPPLLLALVVRRAGHHSVLTRRGNPRVTGKWRGVPPPS